MQDILVHVFVVHTVANSIIVKPLTNLRKVNRIKRLDILRARDIQKRLPIRFLVNLQQLLDVVNKYLNNEYKARLTA